MDSNKCLKHSLVLDYLCQQCQIMLCCKCAVKHQQSNLGHICDDINEINEKTSANTTGATTADNNNTNEKEPESIDLQGLDPNDVAIVMKETNCTKAKAVDALKKTGDVVYACIFLES